MRMELKKVKKFLRGTEGLLLIVCMRNETIITCGFMNLYSTHYKLTPKISAIRQSYIISEPQLTPKRALALNPGGYATDISSYVDSFEKEELSEEDLFIELESNGLFLFEKAKIK